MRKKIIAIVVLLLIIPVVFIGCKSESKQEQGIANNDSEVSKSASNGSASNSTSPSVQKPDKIRVFYGNGGISVPEDIDYRNNPFINEIASIANVEITEAIVPPYADTKTKFNLMVSSGDIPDFVHCWFPSDVQVNGKNGAFLELTDIIKNSIAISSKYSEMQIDLMRDEEGKIYALRSIPSEDVNHTYGARYDLLEELGYTEIPDTVDEWINAMRKLKIKYPDSIPFTSVGIDIYHDLIFNAYGCGSGYGWYTNKDGKFSHVFENPLLKDAINVYKLMLKEELMDKEFVTNKRQDFEDKRLHKKVLIGWQNMGAVIGWIDRFNANNIPDAMFVPVSVPILNDSRVDPNNVYSPKGTLGGHCISISSKTTKKDAAIRLMETFISDEIKDLFVYGRSGIEYNI